MMPFKARTARELELAFGRSTAYRRMLQAAVADGAQQAQRLGPQNLTGGRRIQIEHGVRIGDTGTWEGFVKAKGWNWHFPEFGALNWPARPYLRPGVNTALVRRGGRLKET
jgi:hypothetical protein